MNWPRHYVTFDVDDGLNTWTALRVLALLAEFIVPLRWKAVELDLAPSPAAERVQDFLAQQAVLDGPRLLALFSGDPQVVEGSLVGESPQSGDVMLVVKAVDGMHWDIYSNDKAAIQEVQRWTSSSRIVDR